MNADSPNPYQVSAIDPQQAIEDALDESLRTCDQVEFAGEITQRDLVAAVRQSAMRRDLRSLRRSRLFVTIAAVLMLTLVALRWMRGGTIEGLPFLIGGLAVVLVYAAGMHRWLVSRFVRHNRDIIGPIKGRIDRESLWIENEHQTRYRPLRCLVGTDVIARGWVLCFDPSLSMFEMLPMTGFADQDTASIVAQNLSKARPFSKVVAFDSRRLEPPMEESRFVPGENALCYAGELRIEDIKGTPLASSHRWAKFRAILRVLVTLVMVIGFVAVTSFSLVLTVAAATALVVLFGRVIYCLCRAPFAGQADEGVLWRSAGWIDDEGMVSITAVGQTQSKWSAFDRAAITDRAITIRTNSGALWHLTGRRQFQDDSQWEEACTRVRDQFPAD